MFFCLSLRSIPTFQIIKQSKILPGKCKGLACLHVLNPLMQQQLSPLLRQAVTTELHVFFTRETGFLNNLYSLIERKFLKYKKRIERTSKKDCKVELYWRVKRNSTNQRRVFVLRVETFLLKNQKVYRQLPTFLV